MRAGAREFLTQPMAAATVAEAFMRAAARRQTGAAERAGKVLVFQGAKGGVGATTLAINFAVALTKENAELTSTSAPSSRCSRNTRQPASAPLQVPTLSEPSAFV